ncbi:hypothetical protein BCP12_017 [Bacillus phage BCP12]|uniref:Uncharacterized protein n=3 Tax=Tsarbombavirus BCP78 TaxID=1985182 RepID=A0A2S0CS96_9CAUD|nr:hypothetical protein BCP12_017 [Bacillus phage BCP12]
MSVQTKVKLRMLLHERVLPSLKEFGLVILIILAANIYLYFRPVPDIQHMLNLMVIIFSIMYALLVTAWYFLEISPAVNEVYEERALHNKYSFISKRFKGE